MASNGLPNVVIAGTVKGGTTSLFMYLSRHPEICGSSIKETCYFLPLRYHEEMQPLDTSRSYFRQTSGERYILEATPGYFEGGRAVAEAIREQLGDVRIIISLRDPVDRLISFFNYKKSRLLLDRKLTLEDYVSRCANMSMAEKRKRENDAYWGVEGGFYSAYLPHWFDVFGDSIKVVFFDDLRNDPVGLLGELCSWLDISPAPYVSASMTVENKTVDCRNRYLHKIALAVNGANEKFFRSHPGLKNLVRTAYYRLNGDLRKQRMSEHTLKYLRSLYTPSLLELGRQLAARGFDRTPDWIPGLTRDPEPAQSFLCEASKL
jgi:hypothetical protein